MTVITGFSADGYNLRIAIAIDQVAAVLWMQDDDVCNVYLKGSTTCFCIRPSTTDEVQGTWRVALDDARRLTRAIGPELDQLANSLEVLLDRFPRIELPAQNPRQPESRL